LAEPVAGNPDDDARFADPRRRLALRFLFPVFPLGLEPGDDNMANERRMSRRATVDLPVEERQGDALYFQRATNLSVGGVYLDRTLPHPPGTAVTLDLHVPGEREAVRVLGHVVGAGERELGMRVRFVAVSAGTRAILSQLVMRRSA
jgi:hypothetical protein